MNTIEEAPSRVISAGPPSIDNRTARIRTEKTHYR
jgi:hypothetical protein